MKFKLDESIGRRGLELLKASGHDVMTVWDQDLRGVTDEELFEVCSGEGQALVTLDRDFGQITRFPPEKSAGIIVLNTGPRTTLQEIVGRLRDSWRSSRATPSQMLRGLSNRDACGFTIEMARVDLENLAVDRRGVVKPGPSA